MGHLYIFTVLLESGVSRQLFYQIYTFVYIDTVVKLASETETKRLMRRLRIYNSSDHPHQAQKPIKIDVSNFYLNPAFSNENNSLD